MCFIIITLAVTVYIIIISSSSSSSSSSSYYYYYLGFSSFFSLQDGIVLDGLTDVYNKFHMVRIYMTFHYLIFLFYICFYCLIIMYLTLV